MVSGKTGRNRGDLKAKFQTDWLKFARPLIMDLDMQLYHERYPYKLSRISYAGRRCWLLAAITLAMVPPGRAAASEPVVTGEQTTASEQAVAGEQERGKKIAKVHCARCHVAGDFNPMGGISSTPSFYLLVREFDDWRQRFETFYLRRPHGAFITLKGAGRLRNDLPANAHPIELSARDVRDVTVYAASLRK